MNQYEKLKQLILAEDEKRARHVMCELSSKSILLQLGKVIMKEDFK